MPDRSPPACLRILLPVLALVLSPAPCALADTMAGRIVTLSPHLAELVCELDACDRLVGVSEYSDYPRVVTQLPRVGGAAGFDQERIITLAPDHVLAWEGGTRPGDIDVLRRQGLTVTAVPGGDLADMLDAYRLLGDLLGRSEQAERRIADFTRRLARLEERYQDAPPLPVFIEIESRPLMGLGQSHAFSEALLYCGLVNILDDVGQAALAVDIETVLARQPAYVLLPRRSGGMEMAGPMQRYRMGEVDGVLGLVGFADDQALRQTARMLDAVEVVCAELRNDSAGAGTLP